MGPPPHPAAWSAFREQASDGTLIWTSGLQDCVSGLPVRGDLLLQPQETHTAPFWLGAV